MGQGSTATEHEFEQQLRDMNEALLVSSVRLHELAGKTEQAQQKAELAAQEAEQALKQSEHDRAALLLSEEQFRRAVEEAPIPVIMHAEDGEVLQISRTWTDLTGYTIEDKDVIQSWLTMAYGFGGEEVRDAMHDAFLPPQNGEGPMRSELFEIVTRSGEHRSWSFSASTPGVLRDGRRFVVGTAEDITERIRYEEELRENQTRLADSQMSLAMELSAMQQLQEVSIELVREDDPEALYEKIVDAAVMIMRSQYASIQMFHPERGKGELRLLAFRGFNPQAAKFWEWVRPGSKSTCGIALRTGKRVIIPNLEASDELAGGEDLAVYLETGIRAVQSSPLLSRSGQILGMISTHWGHPHNPTERDLRLLDVLARQAADVIERANSFNSLQHLASIVKSTDDAIISKDLDGVITSWNKSAERLFGYTSAEVIGKPVTILIPRERLGEEPEILERIRAGKSIDHYETIRRRKDGTEIAVSLTVSPIRNESGQIVGASKIARDITHRKETEEAIRNSEMLRGVVNAQEQERQRVARDLHDTLGQQLTGLRLKLEGLKSHYKGKPAMVKALDEIQNQALQIDKEVSFLAWELRPTALDNLGLRNALGNYVVGWSKNYKIPAEFHTASLRKKRLAPEIEINLYRIAQEALNNVLKHASASNVEVMLEYGEGDVVLVVEDNGVGFDAAARSKPNKQGRGLGLIGMRERAALLGGTLEIESAKGKGTTVIARVPIAVVETTTKK